MNKWFDTIINGFVGSRNTHILIYIFMKKKAVKKSLTLAVGPSSLLLGLSLVCLPAHASTAEVNTGSNAEAVAIAQQSGNVKGIVKDQKGEPLIGVSILVKGTTNGTASDFDGNFALDAKKGDVLVFSFIGFKSQEITYTGQRTLNVILAEDTEALDEVVVVGYGSQKKGEITFGDERKGGRFQQGSGGKPDAAGRGSCGRSDRITWQLRPQRRR